RTVLLHTHFPISTLFFYNTTPPTEISTLSLHDALPISPCAPARTAPGLPRQLHRTTAPMHTTARSASRPPRPAAPRAVATSAGRSEEHTSELQSLTNLVCRLLLEKKK